MYESHFKLTRRPFSPLPEPDALYPSQGHIKALSMIEYGISSGAAFTVITGEIGAGKTTLLRFITSGLGPDCSVGIIVNTHENLGEPLTWVAQAFNITTSDQSLAALYKGFLEFIALQVNRGKRTLLFIDEAQNYSAETLEKFRLLSNINSGAAPILQLVLMGQPELLELLRRPELKQLAQRISVSYHLGALSEAETIQYVNHSCRRAGATEPLFTNAALHLIFEFTGGVPRLINILCDLACVYSYAEDQRVITPDILMEVVRDRADSGLSQFRIPGNTRTATNLVNLSGGIRSSEFAIGLAQR